MSILRTASYGSAHESLEVAAMALVSCPDCRTPVSDTALICPKCGRPLGARMLGGLVATALALIVVGAAVALAGRRGHELQPANSSVHGPVARGTVIGPVSDGANLDPVDRAMIGAHAVKQAAELYQNLEGSSDVCPTMQNLVQARKLASNATDSWGSEYRIECASGEIRVYSNGGDRKPGTVDDLRDNFTPTEVQHAKDLTK